MLETLRSIVQSVNGASGLKEAVDLIVRGVKDAMAVDVCSVYLAGPDKDYVLMATDGLNPSAVGKVRLKYDEGLVGLIGLRQEPLNLINPADHPRYAYFSETGEERYHSFLGVPIIHYRKVLGVLVVQQREYRRFGNDEEAFLVTVSAQLAGAITHVAAGADSIGLLASPTDRTGFIHGVRGAPGVAIGTIVMPDPLGNLLDVPDREVSDPKAEERAFRKAILLVQEELEAGSVRMSNVLPRETRALFDVYVMLLGSERLISDTVERIHAGMWAPAALRETIFDHVRVFEQMEDPYLRARAEDIRDIGRRILLRLHGDADAAQARKYPKKCILVGDEIGVGQVAEVPVERLAGIVCVRGSKMSHIVIVAKALGIPAVMGLGDLPLSRLDGHSIVVDGYKGRVSINPKPAVLKEFRRLVKQERKLSKELDELHGLPAEALDGARMSLYVNAGLLSDVKPALRSGAEGVGLYRTEFPFMVRQSFPSEDEQYKIYREVLQSFAPKAVIMRTLDVGGDKPLPYFPIAEDNPYLGWRGIRFTLDHPEIFLVQLRAMLRANVGLQNLRILLPMVSRIDEVDSALALLDRAHEELQEEGFHLVAPMVGVMIEVPAVLYQAEAFLQRVDFLSIGTNDLTQYLLAVDRNNPRVASLYDSLHPAVLQAIDDLVQKAHRFNKSVSLCGEMAGDPAAVILLLGMGVDILSMSAPSLPRVKWVIRSFTRQHAVDLLSRVMGMEDVRAIRAFLNAELDKAGLGSLVRAGK
jgi:phosphotransferase system enzyme I (PtsP)